VGIEPLLPSREKSQQHIKRHNSAQTSPSVFPTISDPESCLSSLHHNSIQSSPVPQGEVVCRRKIVALHALAVSQQPHHILFQAYHPLVGSQTLRTQHRAVDVTVNFLRLVAVLPWLRHLQFEFPNWRTKF
jgi:hypothetical protein